MLSEREKEKAHNTHESETSSHARQANNTVSNPKEPGWFTGVRGENGSTYATFILSYNSITKISKSTVDILVDRLCACLYTRIESIGVRYPTPEITGLPGSFRDDLESRRGLGQSESNEVCIVEKGLCMAYPSTEQPAASLKNTSK